MDQMVDWFGRARSRWWEWVFMALCYGGVTALLARNFYFQAENLISGDLWAQIHVAIDPPGSVDSFVPVYSLYRYIFRFLHWVWPNNWTYALFVLVVALAGCLVTGAYLRAFTLCKNPALCMLFGLGLYCADPIFLPMLNPWRVMGLQTGGLWHNPTLLGIKLMGIVLLWLFARIAPRIDTKAPAGLLCGFALAGMIGTWIKPNLVLCFYPALAIVLLIWLRQKRMKAFWRLAALAVTVLPSMGVLLWQYLLTYGESSVQESGFGILFGFNISLFAERPVASVLQSLAFPLAVLMVCWRSFKRVDQYCLVWIATGVGYLQYLFLVETGPRLTHGNWNWGVYVMVFLLFVVSFEELQCQMQEQWRKSFQGRVWVCTCWGLLSWHVACGIVYLFAFLLQGTFVAG